MRKREENSETQGYRNGIRNGKICVFILVLLSAIEPSQILSR